MAGPDFRRLRRERSARHVIVGVRLLGVAVISLFGILKWRGLHLVTTSLTEVVPVGADVDKKRFGM